MGLGLVGFGILRGATSSGPAGGVRLLVAIAPPLDASTVAMAEQVARERIEEKGVETRVLPAGDHLIIEIGNTTAEIFEATVELLQRTANVETGLFDPAVIARAYVDDTGVEVLGRTPDAFANVHPGDKIQLVVDGKPRRTAEVDHVTGGDLHIAGGGLGSDRAGFQLADETRAILALGAVHPLRITSEERFTRATGFLPRAWPFAVPGLAALVLAVLLGVSRRAKPAD